MYKLANVVMPNADDNEYRDLFFRMGLIEAGGFGETYDVWQELHFNTWMNAFSARKWYHYCALGKLYLGLCIRGKYSVELVGSERNVAYTRIDTKLSYSEHEGDGSWVYIPVEGAEAYDAVHFILRFRKKEPCHIGAMGWFTDAAPRQDNRLGIVICTFKREKYVYRNIALFESFLEREPSLRNRMHMFIADNGQTLDTEKKYPDVDVFPNINAGGAGGFGRGLIEVCRAGENYTRCLFMDDDVEIIPESFYRTLLIADYLRPEYENAQINGAMLDMNRRTFFYENLAIQKELWVDQYHHEGDLYDYDEVLRVTRIPEEVFHNKGVKANAPWYYCCFKIEKDETIDDLPLPIFIRGDDVEWGWRNSGTVIISMNGICVWHAPFYYRVNKVTDGYYLARNMFMINALYTEGFKDQFAKLISYKFHYAIETYDYVSARLIVRALDDILKGSALFDEDPVALMAEVSAMGREDWREVTEEKELLEAKERKYEPGPLRRKINWCIRAAYRLLPFTKCIVKRPGTNVTVDWFPPREAFLVKKHARVYHLLNGTVCQRDFDYKLERELSGEYKTKLAKIEESFDALKADYAENYGRLTSYEFWKKYLRLE